MPLRSLTALTLAAVTALVLATAGGAAASTPRIVALTPFTANALAALNVPVYARGDMPGARDDYLPSVRSIRKLPLSHPNGPNMEQLALMNPTLVLSSPEWSKGEKTMRQLGMEVVDSDPQSVAAVPGETIRIGRLVGKLALAKKRAANQRQAIATAQKRAKRHPRVLLVLGVGRTPYAFLANSWGGDVVKQAGGTLITGGMKNSGGFARIQNEFVVDQKPDVIVAVPHGTTDAAGRRELATFLRTNPAWQDTPAVKAGKLFVAENNALLQATPLAASLVSFVQTQYLENR